MALSKDAAESRTPEGLDRLLAPWEELASDVAEALQRWFGVDALRLDGAVCGRAEQGVCEALETWLERSKAVVLALTDLVGAEAVVPVALIAFHCAAGSVMVAGFTVPLQACHYVVSMVACHQLRHILDHTEEVVFNQRLQRRSAYAMMACYLANVFMAVSGGGQTEVWRDLFYFGPTVALHYMQDLIIYPCVILNMASLASCEDALPSVVFSVVGTGLSALACTTPYINQQLSCTLLGAVCYTASLAHAGHLPAYARQLSRERGLRCQRALDVLSISMPMYAAAQYFGYVHALSAEQVAAAFVGLDMLKCAAVHSLYFGQAIDEPEEVPIDVLILQFEGQAETALQGPRVDLPEPGAEPGTQKEREAEAQESQQRQMEASGEGL